MNKKKISEGVVHTVPIDLAKALTSSVKILDAWNNLTPLGRNEFICWVTSVKKQETRNHHIKRLSAEILEGKRRPCCWPGCPHRSKL
ncbi:MAG: YdeI/OmpD-associated family protein [Candidatus Pacearchaeota archaeon]